MPLMLECATKDNTKPAYPGVGLSLEDLPVEIIIDILKQIPDLDCLWKLLRVSPLAWRVFNENALSVFEAVMGNSLLLPEYKQLIRAVVMARACLASRANLDQYLPVLQKYQLKFEREGVESMYGWDASTLKKLNPSAKVLQSVVSTTRHISILSHACLSSYLSQVQGPSFAPQRPQDRFFSYISKWDSSSGKDAQSTPTTPWQKNVVGEPIIAVDAGQPSWVEEMRVVRALWHIQLVGEIQILAKKGAGRHEGLEPLLRLGPDEFIEVRNFPRCGPVEEVRTVMEFLEDIRDDCPRCEKKAEFTLPHPPKKLQQDNWDIQSPSPVEFRWGASSVDAMVDHGDGLATTTLGRPEDVGEEDLRPSEAHQWGQTRHALKAVSDGITFHQYLSGSRFSSPLYGVKFDSFRRLGFALWDKRRMHLLGVLKGAKRLHPQASADYHAYMYAWESLLSAEEVSSVKAKLEEGCQEYWAARR